MLLRYVFPTFRKITTKTNRNSSGKGVAFENRNDIYLLDECLKDGEKKEHMHTF